MTFDRLIRHNPTATFPKRINRCCRFPTSRHKCGRFSIMNDRHRLKTDLFALGLLAATVFVALSLFSHDPADPPAATVYPARTSPLNTCGTPGAIVSHALCTAFGVGSWFALVVMTVVDVRLFSRKTEHDPLVRGFGWGLLLLVVCIGCRSMLEDSSGGTILG